MNEINIQRYFSFRRVLIPVLIGVCVAALLVFRNFDASEAAYLDLFRTWTYQSTLWTCCALLMMAVRDLAYMYRIRLLTDFKLSWRDSFQVIMLWEFSSALTPSVVGGSAVALFIVAKEGIRAGRSTAIVLITALLDEMFYVICVPLIFIFLDMGELFSVLKNASIVGQNVSLASLFFIGYGFIVFLTLSIIFGVFVKPHWFKSILHRLFSFGFLKRWQHHIDTFGDDLITTSVEMKGRSLMFWIKAFGSTVFSWLARFTVVNFLIMAVSPNHDNLMVFARQLVMWVVLLISPTPGGSGLAEYSFPLFLGEYIPDGLAPGLAFLWRLFSYYPYLIIGSIVLPLWLKKVYRKRN